MSNATQYEVINKETGEILPVFKYEAGDQTFVVHLADETPIVFLNSNNAGQLENEVFSIREIGTHSQPDGTGTVEDSGIPTE